ncbi:alpha/beta hydrolase domain-containing protein 17C [Gadus macrocephalus]|uniref:alpha/beta hydrolase domain-containing protein 17C n=1 Tax=Gadus macrocephalus TaxID=80720 RepID=UPI0028CB5369|nr:alpha/beta hydrolase domain-containing protein 17C [Gadus macrocephalus]
MPEQGPRMNVFSLGELCWLFCCPPCPSRIAAKLAFLPPEPTYSVHTDPQGASSLHLTERADWQYSQRELDAVEVFNTRSSRGNRHLPTLLPLSRYGVTPENIILYGQSIGTVPTVDLAARYEVAAVILHSPLMSGLRVAFPDTRKTYCFDAFPGKHSIDKVSKVASPVLVIHGTEDEVIDFSHGLAMYERCPRAVEPLWVEGAGHNDIELYAQYLERLKQFITVELPAS